MVAPEAESDDAAPATEQGPDGTPSAERRTAVTLPSDPGGAAAPTTFSERDPAALDDATELYLMDRYAADDGTVTVQLLGWERDGDVVRVAYALPTGERRRDRYRWPTAGRYDDSDFLALVRGLGYEPGAADHVAGEFARARVENGRWRIVTGRDAASDGGPDDSRLRRSADQRLDVADPMRLGTVAVALSVLGVVAPAALATALGGLSASMAALGGVLFAGSAAALSLSVAAAR